MAFLTGMYFLEIVFAGYGKIMLFSKNIQLNADHSLIIVNIFSTIFTVHLFLAILAGLG